MTVVIFKERKAPVFTFGGGPRGGFKYGRHDRNVYERFTIAHLRITSMMSCLVYEQTTLLPAGKISDSHAEVRGTESPG